MRFCRAKYRWILMFFFVNFLCFMDKQALFERLLKFADFPLFSNPGERRLKSNLDEHYYYKREKLSHYFHECCETFQFLLWNMSINVVKHINFCFEIFPYMLWKISIFNVKYFHQCCVTFPFLLWNISINVVTYFHFCFEIFLSMLWNISIFTVKYFHQCCVTFPFLLWNISINVV